ncbi:MAG TPA: magnesium transporter [Terriglobia bacterium]|nr:magnesium transporter [Terriglobia bacterium]
MEDFDNSAPPSLLDTWPTLTPEERVSAFESLPRAEVDDFFFSLSSFHQAELLQSLPEGQQRLWLRVLAPDDAADLIQLWPEEDRRRLLDMLDDVNRREVVALLAYAEDEAGGLMNPRFARLRPEMPTDEAFAYLRRQAPQLETIYYAYVLDSSQRLLGVLTIRQLFAADRSKTVRDVMNPHPISVHEDTDQEALVKLFTEHHLLAIPVVDADNRMVGIVTVDDIVDVAEEEASEDLQKVGGMEALGAPYLQTSLLQMIRKRAGWLSVLFLGEMLTATAMSYFEAEIARAVLLVLFIPMIISSGGNSGSQATTLVIRAMAVGEIRLRDWWRVVRREIAAGAALGGVLGIIGVTRILLWQAAIQPYGPHYAVVALTVGCSLFGVVLFGTLAGSMLPFLLRRLGFDPASASAPFVATLVDVTGLVIYFTVASITLSGTLL